jgi:TonB family protein
MWELHPTGNKVFVQSGGQVRKLFALTTGLIVSLSQAQWAFGQVGDLAGLSNIKVDMAPLPEKIASQESSLRSLIDDKLKAADINISSDSASRLRIDIKPQSSQMVLTLSVIEPVPLPSNPAVKKDVTVWSQESTCPAKRVNDSLTTLLDTFAIQYLKDNRGSNVATIPATSDVVAAASSNSSTSAGNSDTTSTPIPPRVHSHPMIRASDSSSSAGTAIESRPISVSTFDSEVASEFQAFSKFAEQAGAKIKKGWVPPKEHSQDVEVTFSVDSTGAVVDPRIVDTRVNFPSQDAAKLAIATAAPFKSLMSNQLEDLEYVVFKCSFFPTGVLLSPVAEDSKRRLSNAAVSEMKRGDFDSAIKKCVLSLKFDRDYLVGRANLAIAYNNKGMLLKKEPLLAKAYFEKALSIDSSNPKTHENLAAIELLINSNGSSASETSAVSRSDTSAPKSIPSIDTSKKYVSKGLEDMWRGAQLEQKGSVPKPVRVRLKLNAKGNLSDVPSNPDVYNSCGVPADDSLARECVKNAAPYSFHSVDSPSAFYLASFDVNHQTVEITSLPDVKYDHYMKGIQGIIKTAWFPPKGNETKRVTVRFDVLNTGTTRNAKVFGSSNIPAADDAALSAIKNVILPPLPPGSPDWVTIEFTFDYNVFAKKPGAAGPSVAH